jgi:hypothetical protein
MVLTKARYINVTDDDHLIVIFRENSIVDHICHLQRSSVDTRIERDSRFNLLIVLHTLESSITVPEHTAPAFGQDLPCQDLHLGTQG